MLIISEREHHETDLSEPGAINRVHDNKMLLEGGALRVALRVLRIVAVDDWGRRDAIVHRIEPEAC